MHTIRQYHNIRPMWVYEKNFALLNNLCPDLDIENECLCICSEGEFEHRLKIQVIERCPYTMTLKLQQNLLLPDQYVQKLIMIIRLYHDAQVADVLKYQGFSCLFESCGSTKKQGMQKNDKRQTNILLHDWLSIFISRNIKQKAEYV